MSPRHGPRGECAAAYGAAAGSISGPLTPHLAPATRRLPSAPGQQRGRGKPPPALRVRCRWAGSGRRADGHPCLSRSGGAARPTAAVRHGRPRGGRKAELEGAGVEPPDREAARRRPPEGLQPRSEVPSRSLRRRGSAVPAPQAAPRGRRAPALAARSGLGAEHSRLRRISLPAASRRRLAHSRLRRRQGRALTPQLLQWHCPPTGLHVFSEQRAWAGAGGPGVFPSLSAASAATGPHGGRGGPRLSRGCAAPLLAEGSEGTSLLHPVANRKAPVLTG